MLTNLQKDLLDMCKQTNFHTSMNDLINQSGYKEGDVIEAMKELKKKRIALWLNTDLDSFIRISNYGWNVMGWSK